MREQLQKHRELISYIFWGVITTVVNYAVYFGCTELLQIYYVAGNLLAWLAAVAVAFFVNKRLVFRSRNWAWKTVFPELWKFVSARILSGVMETALLFLFVSVFCLPHEPVKLAVGVLVVLTNYTVSKLLIFKNGGAEVE